LAKRRKPTSQSLFDDMDPEPGGSSGGDAAIRSSLLGSNGGGTTENVPLHEAAQARYINYALSVITAPCPTSATASSRSSAVSSTRCGSRT
jgi:hypothetical protein